MKKEIWKNIPGYEGLYQVSDLGRVRSVNRRISHPTGTILKRGRLLKIHTIKNGYSYVSLSKNGHYKSYMVHRLVAEVFVPNPYGKPCVDHINAIRKDCRACNLRWVSVKENCANPLWAQHLFTEERNKKVGKANSKIVVQYGLDGKKIGVWDSTKKAGSAVNGYGENIAACCRGERTTAYGYRWEYKEKRAAN